jgi:foldase protein PrsA
MGWPSKLTVLQGVATLALVWVAVGCGASGRPSVRFTADADTAVAKVGDRIITKGRLDHWMHIAAIRDYELFPKGPVPSWVVPDPPSFSKCVAHLESEQDLTKFESAAKRHADALAKCRQSYKGLRVQALRGIISGEWLIEIGNARGLKFTPLQKRRWYEKELREQLGTLAAVPAYFRTIGETYSDQRFRAETKLVSLALESELGPPHADIRTHRAAVAGYLRRVLKKWSAKTICMPGYVVQDCSEYRGPGGPEITIL